MPKPLRSAAFEPALPSARRTSLLDGVMERRSRQIIEQVEAWLPADGPVLDLGSGTGHLAARLERERGIAVIAADVSDIHLTGRPPVLIADGILPFGERAFTASLLCFVLAYPRDPAAVLAEAARVTRGPVIVVQTLWSGRLGYGWHRVREFFWTSVAVRLAKVAGYIAPDATVTLSARRFYSAPELRRDVESAGLRIRSRRERPVLPGRAVVIAAWVLGRDEDG